MICKNVHGQTDIIKEKYTFFVQTDNEKVVTVVARDKITGEKHIGQALCHDNDTFNLVEGIKIAVVRAMEKMYDSTATKDEFRIGDKVRITCVGAIYPSCDGWVKENVPFENYWESGYGVDDKDEKTIIENEYTLMTVAPHENGKDTLGFVCNNEKKLALVVAMDALEKVND